MYETLERYFEWGNPWFKVKNVEVKSSALVARNTI